MILEGRGRKRDKQVERRIRKIGINRVQKLGKKKSQKRDKDELDMEN